jgi:hypothetical protein
MVSLATLITLVVSQNFPPILFPHPVLFPFLYILHLVSLQPENVSLAPH